MSENSISTNHFDWVPFYHEFAKAMLPYRGNQAALIEGIRNAFQKAGIKVPTIDDDGTIDHMDPFTMLGLFNKSGIPYQKLQHA